MPDLLESVRASRRTVYERAKALADRAADENRTFSPSEQSQFDVLNQSLDTFDQRIGQLAIEDRRVRQTEAAFSRLESQPLARGYGGDANPELRAFLQGDPGAPRHYDVRPSGTDFRALSKLTAGAGLNTVPTSFYDQLMQHLIEVSPILGIARTLNTASGENLQIPKTTAHSSAAIVTEGAAIAASDPTFGQTTLGAFKYGVLVQVSRELVDDTGVDLEGYLSEETGRALGNAIGAHIATGTGTGQPRGYVIDATLGATSPTGTVGVPSYDTLVDLLHSVISPYRSSSSVAWAMRDSTVGSIRKIKDTTGQPIWSDSMQQGAPPLLLGIPVVVDPNVAATGLSAKSIVFGDFSRYIVRIAGGVRFERSDDFAFSTDLVTYRALLRADGALVDLTGALKYAVGAAT